MSYDPQKQKNLHSERQNDRTDQAEKEKEASDSEKEKSPQKPRRSFGNLAKKILPPISQMKFSDSAIFVALGAAGFKDLLDLISLTGIGYFLVIIMTFLIFIFIGFMILLTIMSGGGGGFWILLTLFGGAGIELLPGIDFLPVTMATVIMIYLRILSKRRKNQEKMQAQESYA
ncbi:MAG: hypothetical protein A2271_03435 [Candidatus Moranbacteria bacterium RIFOXYA12_FULL_35_19]|nr:MAG: hypothetical protein A2489_03560 [Candidatus Moranbacteria bacterium RIFOXYC12_FULL_36_13]OGI36365.1 MAG: hypothetical protein A2271_03435 [Candidatus Moranbacteria bacterium RIFOXYA12_FULL_35_19]